MFKAKNWDSFQSYKDRNPPWIRLHKRLIDDIKFQKMSADARALLPMLWLLISEDENPVSGMLRIGYEEITFRLRQPEKIVKSAINEIIDAGFLEKIKQEKTDSYPEVTEQSQNCYPETEERQRTETYKKEKDALPHFIPKDAWDLYCQHRGKKFTSKAKALALKKLEAWHREGQNIEEILNNSVMNNWKGIFPQQTKGSTNGRYTADDALRDVFAELDREEKANNAPHTPVLLSIE